MRIYDTTFGSILINGIDIKKYSLSYLRSKIGYVSQDNLLFDMTIKQNIVYGCSNALNSEIEEVARNVNARAFIIK